MSYDLVFWSYADESGHPPGKSTAHQATYKSLFEGQTPDTVSPLDKTKIVDHVSDVMAKASGWKQDDGPVWSSQNGLIEMQCGSHYVAFSLRGKWNGEDANRLMDAMLTFGCPLYDPQTGERFSHD